MLTGACFWLMVRNGIAHDYGMALFGGCAGVFYGLGCAILTVQTIRALRQKEYPASSSPADRYAPDESPNF